MPHINMTRVELKKQKGLLNKYRKFLPTLELKKKQLMLCIREKQNEILRLKKQEDEFMNNLKKWIAVFGEGMGEEWLPKYKMITEDDNIAGTQIPVFKEIIFSAEEKDISVTPLWFDEGIKALKESITYKIKIQVLEKQNSLLEKELEKTSQRINLFEKRKIPEHAANISKIKIGLGDQQTNAVARGKIAKNKAVKKRRQKI